MDYLSNIPASTLEGLSEEQRFRLNLFDSVVWLDRRREDPFDMDELLMLAHWIQTGELPRGPIQETFADGGYLLSRCTPR